MLTFEKVLKVFQAYLDDDPLYEVVQTSHGYTLMAWEPHRNDWYSAEIQKTPEEQEELRKREERKDRLHQNYLKRKASGAQKRYEDKIKAKKKAEMDAKKALIRAEDMKKGVFSTIGQLPKEEPRKGSIAASAAV